MGGHGSGSWGLLSGHCSGQHLGAGGLHPKELGAVPRGLQVTSQGGRWILLTWEGSFEEVGFLQAQGHDGWERKHPHWRGCREEPGFSAGRCRVCSRMRWRPGALPATGEF